MIKRKEKHPEWFYDVPDMRTIILGTYPPTEPRWDYPFYYPNKINRFWKAMAAVAGKELKYFKDKEAVDERKSLMDELKVGVQNLGKTIEREDESASDDKIEILEFFDLKKLIGESSTLKNIFLTGYSGKTSTYTDFLRYLELEGIEVGKHPKMPCAGYTFLLHLNGKEFKVIVGNSTSAAARRITLDTVIEQFRGAIFKL